MLSGRLDPAINGILGQCKARLEASAGVPDRALRALLDRMAAPLASLSAEMDALDPY